MAYTYAYVSLYKTHRTPSHTPCFSRAIHNRTNISIYYVPPPGTMLSAAASKHKHTRVAGEGGETGKAGRPPQRAFVYVCV